MNVFEDLVVELKEQNLLEETVIDTSSVNGGVNGKAPVDSGWDAPDASDVNADFTDSHESERIEIELPKLETVLAKPVPGAQAVQKAISEQMSALQMVDHIYSAIERDHSIKVSSPFDDLAVQKSYQRFARESANSGSDEYFDAESALLVLRSMLSLSDTTATVVFR